MADEAKIGTDWTDDELDLIVADYFTMLHLEQAGRSYAKAHHRAELMRLVGRTFGGSTTPFYINRNELSLSSERPDAFRLYRLYSFARAPRLFELAPPLDAALRLDVLAYRASFA